MQKYILIITTILLVVSCKNNKDLTLDDKKALLTEKTALHKALEAEIDQLQEDIASESPKTEKAALFITTLEVLKKEFNRYIDLQAIVMTDDIVNASSEMGGRILKLNVKEGDVVRKGQLIASVDVESVDKQKAEVQKSLDLAVDVFNRQKRLWEQNIGSEVQFLQAKNNKERIEKSMQTIDVQLRKRNIYAPISGAIDKVYLKSGEMAGPGSPIVQILNVSKVKVVTDVPETYLGKVKRGDQVSIEFPAIGKNIVKNISQIGRTIDPSNRTFKMEVLLDNPKGELKPNLLAIVKINDYTQKGAFFIPVDNIQQEVTGKRFVYVVKELNGKKVASKTYVTIGESADNHVIITEGLSEGDKIILKGARNCADGQEVTVDAI